MSAAAPAERRSEIAPAERRGPWAGQVDRTPVVGSRAGLGIALAVLAQSAPLLAQETRTLRAADRVPLHSSVEVSALPAARAAGDSEGAQVRVQPRRRPDPEGLQQLKDALRLSAGARGRRNREQSVAAVI